MKAGEGSWACILYLPAGEVVAAVKTHRWARAAALGPLGLEGRLLERVRARECSKRDLHD